MTLKELAIGKTAVVKSVGGEGALRQHFLDMGGDSRGGGYGSEAGADGGTRSN